MNWKSQKKSNKPLHLVIDGADKVGKTTVCKLLSKKLGIPVIKMQDMPKFFGDNPELASEIFNKTITQFKDTSFILDRGFPSSIVYSTLFSRKYPLDYLNKIIDELNPRVVILEANPRATDDLVTNDEQNKLRDIYMHYSRVYNWDLLICDGSTPDQICKQILKIIS